MNTSFASGKTQAFIKYAAESSLNFIYVAPTIKLLTQTVRDLNARCADRQKIIKTVHKDSISKRKSVSQVVMSLLKDTPSTPTVLAITTKTFLSLIHAIPNKTAWHAVLDEAVDPLATAEYRPPKARKGQPRQQSNFDQLFAVKDGFVHAAPGRAEEVRLVGRASAKASTDYVENRVLVKIAEAVSSPAMAVEAIAVRDDLQSVAMYPRPEPFTEFASMTFMSALFQDTPLYAMWSEQHGIKFHRHPDMGTSGELRDVHAEQGPLVDIYHMLHPDDNSSRYNLDTCWTTGETGAPIDNAARTRALHLAAEAVGDEPFLVHLNAKDPLIEVVRDMYPQADILPPTAHGLDRPQWKSVRNVITLATMNPDPDKARWMQRRLGWSDDRCYLAYRIHLTYQAIGRCALRDPENRERVRLFVVGAKDAEFLHHQFTGSVNYGQCGDMPSVAGLRDAKRASKAKLTTEEKARRPAASDAH